MIFESNVCLTICHTTSLGSPLIYKFVRLPSSFGYIERGRYLVMFHMRSRSAFQPSHLNIRIRDPDGDDLATHSGVSEHTIKVIYSSCCLGQPSLRGVGCVLTVVEATTKIFLAYMQCI